MALKTTKSRGSDSQHSLLTTSSSVQPATASACLTKSKVLWICSAIGMSWLALAVSTSGKSPNLIYALEEARKIGLLTIAWAGKDGGRFPQLADYCFIVPSYSIHRIQEVHATLVHIAWDLIHIALGAEDVI